MTLSLYTVLAAINLALWMIGMIFHVGPGVQLFPVVAIGLLVVDRIEHREQRDQARRLTQHTVHPVEPIGRNPILVQPLMAFGSTLREQTFLPGVSVEQQSARLVVRSRFQQHSTRFVRATLLESKPNSTVQTAILAEL